MPAIKKPSLAELRQALARVHADLAAHKRGELSWPPEHRSHLLAERDRLAAEIVRRYH